MKLICVLSELLLAFAFAFIPDHVHAQSPPGFISLDCGLRRSNGYNDSTTGLYYTTDEAFVETGQGRSISPEFKTNSLPPQFLNVRSFPGPVATRNCYTLRPLYGKGNRILLRVGFMYGNYDGQNEPPQFDLHLGVDYWKTVKTILPDFIQTEEILHTPTSDYLHLCLVNTGLGTPFISLIEQRSMDPSRPLYNSSSASLELLTRWDLGSTSLNSFRYKDGDPFDRIWRPVNLTNTTISSTKATSFAQNVFNPPPVIMRTASQLLDTSDSFTFTLTPNNISDRYYVFLHFAELVANQTREMNIYRNGFLWYEAFVPSYLHVSTIGSTSGYYFYEFQINATTNSKLPAMINAFEVYIARQFLHRETDENDVAAITSIKATYAVTKNWQGDPCLPQNFTWIGVNCSYNAFDPPNIISLNLSSSALVGTVARSISNLTMLQILDLSYNNLTGQVPVFLSWLPSLRYLRLEGNNFTGSLPLALLEKWKNGSLILSFEIPTNHTNQLCANDACKKKKSNSTTVPIVASVAGFLTIFILSTLLYMFIRRKQKGSFIEPQLRQFTFSEVSNMIREKKILGEGGFGHVYQGCMRGIQVAVKVLKVSPEQQTTDFQSEVKILAKVHHTNLTRILGYCNEGRNRAIIFELMENGNMKSHLLWSNPNVLSWEKRLSIMTGAAQGLEYLHHGCDPPIIHRDIKPENILLTKEFVAKLADFGLSRIFPVQTSRIIGTPGYHDPEYNEPGMLTETVDVYSFGVVMLVVVTGQPAIIQQGTSISQWIAPKIRNGDIRGIVDPRLHGNYDVNAAWRVVELAISCVSRDTSSRPNMQEVLKELKECLQTAVNPQHVSEGRKHSNDAEGIALVPSNMKSVFRPSTR